MGHLYTSPFLRVKLHKEWLDKPSSKSRIAYGAMTRFMMFAILIIFPAPSFANNEVNVIADPDDSRRLLRGGRSTIVRPSSFFSDDSRIYYEEHPGARPQAGSQPYQRFFALPQFRGQSGAYSEIYVDDMPIVDPLQNLLGDLQLTPGILGEVQINQGVSPWQSPSMSPAGSLSFRQNRRATPAFHLGIKGGKEFGVLQKLAASGVRSLPQGIVQSSLSLFSHRSPGLDSIYNDNGTPFNAADDSLKSQRNNDSSSQQLLPTISLEHGPWGFSAMARHLQSETELPAVSARRASQAFKSAHSKWLNVQGSYRPQSSLRVALGAGSVRDQVHTTDPTQSVLANTAERSTLAGSKIFFAGMQLRRDQWSLAIHGQQMLSYSSLTRANELRKNTKLEHRKLYGGLQWHLWQPLTLELKASTHQRSSRQQLEMNRVEWHDLAATLNFFMNDEALIYLQRAQYRRQPSLFELFGDGAFVRENFLLEPEQLEHLELGMHWRNLNSEFQLAVFRDQTVDKIVTILTSFSEYKAVNIQQTDVRGLEAYFMQRLDFLDLIGNYSVQRALDVSSHQFPKDIPFVSSSRFFTTLRGKYHHHGKSSWQLHPEVQGVYQSSYYRDPLNTTQVEGHWVWNVGLLAKLLMDPQNTHEVGFYIENLQNTQSLAISSGTQRGRTGFPGPDGQFMAGRSLLVSYGLTLH